MTEKDKSNKGEIEKRIKTLEEKKAAFDKEIKTKKEAASAVVDREFENKIAGIKQEIEEKKKELPIKD